MPNYVIPQQIREHISNNALRLARRPMALALTNFPLTTSQIQYHCVELTDEQVASMRRLDSEGIRTIEHHREVRLALVRQILPELRRSMVLFLRLPEWIFVGRGTQWSIPATKFRVDESHYFVPKLTDLDAKSRQELMVWAERALRQMRLFEITEYCVAQLMLPEHSPTAAHLHALWPTLCTLVDANAGSYHRRNRRRVEPYPSSMSWQEKFRNPTRSLKQYQPDILVREKFTKLIAAADSMILAGRFLDKDIQARRDVIQAAIEHWERLEGDITFPLAS